MFTASSLAVYAVKLIEQSEQMFLLGGALLNGDFWLQVSEDSFHWAKKSILYYT